VKFAGKFLKLSAETGGGLRPARQNDQSPARAGLKIVQTNPIIRPEESWADVRHRRSPGQQSTVAKKL